MLNSTNNRSARDSNVKKHNRRSAWRNSKTIDMRIQNIFAPSDKHQRGAFRLWFHVIYSCFSIAFPSSCFFTSILFTFRSILFLLSKFEMKLFIAFAATLKSLPLRSNHAREKKKRTQVIETSLHSWIVIFNRSLGDRWKRKLRFSQARLCLISASNTTKTRWVKRWVF